LETKNLHVSTSQLSVKVRPWQPLFGPPQSVVCDGYRCNTNHNPPTSHAP